MGILTLFTNSLGYVDATPNVNRDFLNTVEINLRTGKISISSISSSLRQSICDTKDILPKIFDISLTDADIEINYVWMLLRKY